MYMRIKGFEKIEFYNFKITEEKNGNFFLVFNDENYIVNKDVIDVIRLIKKYQTIDKVTKSNKNFTKDFLIKVVNLLISINCVKSVGDTKFKLDHTHLNIQKKKRIITNKIASIFFSMPMRILFIILFITTAFIIVTNNKYIPNYKDYFFSENYLLCILVAFIYGWFSAFKHEFSHFLAARSRNILSKLSVDTRIVFLVTETTFNGIYKIKEEKRYRLYLAGMATDFMFMAIYILLLFLNDSQIIYFSEGFYLLLKSFILIEFLAILWQFLFFMRTDLYYCVADYFDKENLLKDTKKYYSNIFNKIKQKKDIILLSFGLFFIFGVFITIIRFGLYILPIKVQIIYKSLYFIFLSIINNSLLVQDFLYYITILFLEAFNITFMLVIISKKLFSKFFEKEFNLKIKN